MTKPLGTCWMKSTGNGRCARGEATRWILLVNGNWRTPVETWLCANHQKLPFEVVVEAAVPVHEIKTSQPLGITPLRRPSAGVPHPARPRP